MAREAAGVGVDNGCALGTVSYAVVGHHCGGGHTASWTSIPGAIFYEGRLAKVGWPWDSSVAAMWAERGAVSCAFNSVGAASFRMRACN